MLEDSGGSTAALLRDRALVGVAEYDLSDEANESLNCSLLLADSSWYWG
jgi:hypothetical protein